MKTPPNTRSALKTPPTKPPKQNSSHSVAKQYQNNTKTNQKNPPNNKKTHKTTPNRHPHKNKKIG
jgi:hypothetical protein